MTLVTEEPKDTLDCIFKPDSIAVVGASDREGSVGCRIMQALAEFPGRIFPVNMKKPEILGIKAFRSVSEIPGKVDLAIICTPARTVPSIVEECGEAGIKGLVIISAGFKEIGEKGRALEKQLVELKQKYNLKIIGPNCLGIIRPGMGLNATFAGEMPQAGRIAFISQSGALGVATLDWVIHQKIGLSGFVSVGSMLDVDFGELIDYFGQDQETRSILLYIEGITDARRFMSAARHFARTKPVIVVKAGKYAESAKAAASHTGSMTGEDSIYDAAFKRAGIVRVNEIEDLFHCSSILGMQPLPQGPRLAIVTNAGGPGIMATDALVSKGGKLAELGPGTMDMLNNELPPFWSRGNPIDLLGDAGPDRFGTAIGACLKDPNVDGILVINTVQGVADPTESARAVVEAIKSQPHHYKTFLTSFIGTTGVDKANEIFRENSIPSYPTPEQAIDAYMYMYQYKRNLELLYETPEETEAHGAIARRPIMVIMQNAAREGRSILTEAEAKELLENYGIPIVPTKITSNPSQAVATANRMGYPVAMKILSPQITHKTDVGGVALNISCAEYVRSTFESMVARVRESSPETEILGVTIQPMITGGVELIVGSKTDPLFGPVMAFGTGGTSVEVYKDISIGLPPLNQTLVRRMMEETKVYKLLKGYRGKPPANLRLLEQIMFRFSNMLVDFPQIREIDINPLIIDSERAMALDARVVIDPDKVFQDIPQHQHLVISPYPKKYETTWRLKDGRRVFVRPIKPEDENLWLDMFKDLSEDSIRYRFFKNVRETPHKDRVRYCNIDYDREIALLPELEEDGERRILGVARAIRRADRETAELTIIVADKYQGLGLGTKLVDYMIEVCKDLGMKTLLAEVRFDNQRAIALLRKMGFDVEKAQGGVVRARLGL